MFLWPICSTRRFARPRACKNRPVRIALDATYGTGRELTGVGVYSREILYGLARRHPEASYRFCYRSHKFLKSFRDRIPTNAARTAAILSAGTRLCAMMHKSGYIGDVHSAR